MRSITLCVLVSALVSCGGEPPPTTDETRAREELPPEETPAPQESGELGAAEPAEVQEIVGAGEGFNRAMLGAYISVGDPVSAFTPAEDSRFEASGGETRMHLHAARTMNWAITFLVPTGPPDGASDEAQNRYRTETLGMRVTDGEGVEHAVEGHVVITALEPRSGRVSFTVEGETSEGTSVEAEADTRITPLEP